jgi:hypothetical protein
MKQTALVSDEPNALDAAKRENSRLFVVLVFDRLIGKLQEVVIVIDAGHQFDTNRQDCTDRCPNNKANDVYLEIEINKNIHGRNDAICKQLGL